MSAFPGLPPALTPETVLASLRARKDGLALALARDAPADPLRAPADVFSALHMPGAVVELSGLPGAGVLTLGFLLLREAQRRARAQARPSWLCALDPSRTLSGPAVAALGVELERLVVLQPPRERLLRTAARAQQRGVLCATLVDATSLVDLGAWDVGLRRLALAAEQGGGSVVLLTSPRARRGLPIPAGARALVERAAPGGQLSGQLSGQISGGARDGDALHVRFLRHRHGALPRMILPLSRAIAPAVESAP